MSKDTDIEQDVAEKSSDEERFTKDWLISNALTAFLGALMLERELNRLVLLVVEVTIPTYVWTTIFTVIAALFTLSIMLAVASLIPPLRRLAVSIGRRFSLILGILTLSSFILSWSSTVSTLPYDELVVVICHPGRIATHLTDNAQVIPEDLRVGWGTRTKPARRGDGNSYWTAETDRENLCSRLVYTSKRVSDSTTDWGRIEAISVRGKEISDC